ncbi:integration host factor subunit alpha [Microvirga sp. P5_D2]
MAGKNTTRADLTEAVYKNAGLSRTEAAGLVEHVIEGICSTLATGETVKLSGFGVFTVRDKMARMGRNPKTGEEVPITPRKSITFRPSLVLEEHVNGNTKKPLPA